MKRGLAWIAGVLLAAVVLLCWPLGTWIQARGNWAVPGEATDDPPDVVYLVAGEKDQDRRISGLVEFLQPSAHPPQGDATLQGKPRVLVGNDEFP
ncbi:MAG: hypothetical protein HQ559_15095, partial [Lentisphaerae bacterium]|nr:hypothetical protein [Lentisphaerota bacterium]